jgi:predicted MPP superfamily phosphohydrolase
MSKTIKLARGARITVFGDLHEHSEHYKKLLGRLELGPQHLLVCLGDIYDKGDGPEAAEDLAAQLKTLVDQGLAYAIRGNHEQRHIRRENMTPGIEWFSTLPTTLQFRFANGTRVAAVHGGVIPRHTWDDFESSIDTLYVRTVDDRGKYVPLIWKEVDGKRDLVPAREGQVWHELYDGRFGYIISGHDAQADGVPKFYRYSCNIDTKVYRTGILTALTYGENGREDLITIEGEAVDPQL